MADEIQHPFENGPYLQAALICERVIDEKDNVKSAIRIIDRVIRTVVAPNPPQEMEPFTETYYLLLKFKSGRTRGTMPLEVRLEKPDGTAGPALLQTINFEGEDDRGIDIVAQMIMNFTLAGLYWFDVCLSGVRVTRMPLRVVYIPQLRQTRASDEESPPGEDPPLGS